MAKTENISTIDALCEFLYPKLDAEIASRVVVLALLMGSIAFGLVLPDLTYFSAAIAAGKGTFYVIERIPQIDKDARGDIIEDFKGHILFQNVSFHYPTRPEIKTVDDLSIEIQPGKTVAIIGPSGSGKSTTIQLIQRFYDTVMGQILIDGRNIQTLDLRWLRQQIGVVQQEPVLFSGTISENISLGRPGATKDEIVEAAKLADAHDFILKLPQAYDTVINEGGGGMSGGQKQRIAIARALIRSPKILLLDEATSALDTRSEKTVQRALDRARSGRSVVMVAHRLTTVRDADVIVVMDRGRVQEKGTHDELLALNGIYAKMLSTAVQFKSDTEAEANEDEEASLRSESETEDDSWQTYVDDEEVDRPRKLPFDEFRKESVWSVTNRFSDAQNFLDAMSEISGTAKTKKMKNPVWRAVKLNRPEYPYLFTGLFASLIAGLSQPAFALLYSEMFGIFEQNTTMKAKLDQTSFYSGMMALLGFARFLATFLSSYALGYAGAQLTKRARSLLFEAIVHQEIGWFDRIENSPGILTARLATEVSALETVTGLQLGTLAEAVSLIIACLVLGFIYSWALSLVNLCFAPLLVVATALQMSYMKLGVGAKEVQGSQVVQEALSAERTVTSFGLEDHFFWKFKERLATSPMEDLKDALLYGLVNGVAQSLPIFQGACTFYVGAVLLDKGESGMIYIFGTFAAFSFGSQGLGRISSMFPEIRKASHNVKLVFATLDRKTRSDPNEGEFPSEPFNGCIDFRKIHFHYPTRANVKVLNRFSHKVEAGQSVALVGQSGCGKSTLLQLVQRFYDVSNHGAGSGIFISGHDLRKLAPNWIRQQIGIVSQEPNLFDMSIRDNIAYGDNSRELSMEEIIRAAKEANAHTFIEALPDGYNTSVGARGSQLSGGQKQRIAIARALVRKPKLLLLDEATSALDNESERIVQAALDDAMAKGDRTCLVVAHRLTTVEKCDVIVVLQDGQRVEYGNPSTLMASKGVFYTLHNVDAAVKLYAMYTEENEAKYECLINVSEVVLRLIVFGAVNCATLDRKTRSDPNEGEFPSEPFNGCIDFRKIHFHYPTRANVKVLNRFSHKVEAGQSVALVGQSGCGKSTLLQLVQRFYDVSNHGAGSGIFISGHDLRKLAPNWIRQQIGIVSQEPNLFDMSIRDNIAYGDNSRELSMEEIIRAAKEANAHTFIEALPDISLIAGEVRDRGLDVLWRTPSEQSVQP
ncbi:hypothetical protein ACTXT7_002876 [Hymenolepis weldensis]